MTEFRSATPGDASSGDLSRPSAASRADAAPSRSPLGTSWCSPLNESGDMLMVNGGHVRVVARATRWRPVRTRTLWTGLSSEERVALARTALSGTGHVVVERGDVERGDVERVVPAPSPGGHPRPA